MSSTEPADERLSTAEVEEKFRKLSPADWARARSLANFCAANLQGWSGDELLSEAVVKLLSGERVWRPDVLLLVTLKNVMHSIASNEHKRNANGPIDQYAVVDTGTMDPDDEHTRPVVDAVNHITPEIVVDQRSQIERLSSVVSGNEDEEMVLLAWAEGLSGKAAAEEIGMDMKKYEAARKRIDRKLKQIKAERGQ